MSGWFAVKRGALEHELFAPKGPFSKFEAWVWMVENAPFKDGEVIIKGKTYPTKRGHLYHSIRFMAGKFRWSEKAVRVFVNGLVEAGVLEKRGAHLGAHFGAQLRLCNYDKYQFEGHTKGHTQGHKEEQSKTIPVGANASAPPDLAKLVFDHGIQILVAAGKRQDQARSIIGMWRKDSSDAQLFDAIGKCQREGAVDPVGYIGGILKFTKAAKREVPTGYTDAGAFGLIPERN